MLELVFDDEDFVLPCCVSCTVKEGFSVDSDEEEERGFLILAEDEGLKGDLVGLDEPLAFFGNTELEFEELELLVDLDEEEEEEAELL